MTNTQPNPPRAVLRFFKWFCNPSLHKYLEGDLLELYDHNIKTEGKSKASWRFTWEVIKLFRPGIIKDIDGTEKLNNYGMLNNYFKVSIRNILRNK
ncbi:MAG: permease prefix domain 2-containing transporter, partial [Bacteroidota bacterium]